MSDNVKLDPARARLVYNGKPLIGYVRPSKRRAPVQANKTHAKPRGTINWSEHEKAWQEYARRCGRRQTAERIAERGGFCYGELVDFLGAAPATWKPL